MQYFSIHCMISLLCLGHEGTVEDCNFQISGLEWEGREFALHPSCVGVVP